MDEQQVTAARIALAGAYDGSKDFPAIVSDLMEAGFEGYTVDYRSQTSIYYLPSGESFALPLPPDDIPVAANFNGEAVKAAIREAQMGGADYSYRGFCEKVKTAGCAGYIVSFSGRRVLYFGRTAETHVENFPDH